MKKTILIIVGVLLVAGLVGGGYYLWQNQAKYPWAADLIKKTGLNKEPQWSIFPNYTSPTAVIHDGDTYWLGSSGGILRYNEKAKETRFYNKSNGLLDNDVWSMLKVDDKIWFTIQGAAWSGEKAAGAGVQAINIKSGEIIKAFPASSIVPLGIIDIFSPFGNPKLYQDPYDKSLWIATMRGLYGYDEKTDKWNYINSIVPSLHDIYDLAFTKEGVFARTADEGILYLNKTDRIINNISNEEGYLLSSLTDFLVSNSESAFAAGRPKEYTSCGDKDKKASIVEKYIASKGWDKIDVLNNAINYDEAVKSLVIKGDQLWVYILTNDCSGGAGQKQFFILKYDTAKNKITERVRDQEDDKYMNMYSNLDQAKIEDYSTIAQKIEKETGIPSQKDIAFIDKNNRIIVQSGNFNQKGASYAYFDPKTNTYDFSLWDKIKVHKEISESEFSFKLMSCNQYNDSNKEDLIFIYEYYIGMGGPSESSIYAYSKKNNSLEKYVFKYPDESEKYYPSYFDALICNSKELIYPSNKGMVSMDWATKKETIYSDDFKPFTNFENGWIQDSNMGFFDGSKRYFLAEGAKIGYFDVNSKKYFYDYQIPNDLNNAEGGSYHFSDHKNWFGDMVLKWVANGKMYFYLNDKNLDENLPPRSRAIIVFDTTADKYQWFVYPIDEKLSPSKDWISDVKFWDGKIWITLSEATTITIDASGNQQIVDSKDGMLDKFGNIFPSDGSIWFSGGAGIWGLER